MLTIRWRMGRALAMSKISKNSGCSVGSPPEICTTSGWPSLRTTASSIRFDLRRVAELLALGAAVGVADGAAQIAGVGDLDEGQAGVLLVIGAESAVVGAAPLTGVL